MMIDLDCASRSPNPTLGKRPRSDGPKLGLGQVRLRSTSKREEKGRVC